MQKEQKETRASGKFSCLTVVRLTPGERAQIERMARANSTTMSDVMRSLFDVGFRAANDESSAKFGHIPAGAALHVQSSPTP